MEVMRLCITHIAVPLTESQRDALDALKAQGFQKGHWVAQAIRERLEREGLIGKEGER